MKKTKPIILVVDDNGSNIDILLNILSDYDVIPALSGKNALEIVKEEKVDLILLDIMMPEMDGFEVCKLLKSELKTSKIPIVFLTSKHNMEDIQRGFELGAIDYITKPFNPIELLVRINTHLELRTYQHDLELKVKEEVEKNKYKEQMIFQQSKQAEIGELLMHIAHQWKQPLSELGSITTYNTALLKSNEDISKEDLLINFDKYSNILTFMSNTVETFQDFYKPNHKNSFFDLSTTIDTAINIIDATLNYENIKLTIEKNSNPKVYGNKNEYAQVILAILNNAKDILISRDIENPNITITIDKKDNKSIVTIVDNGKGIQSENIYDIFLPYTSQKNSMGIGLYMAKTIMEKNGGAIDVENTKKGAKFTIIL